MQHSRATFWGASALPANPLQQRFVPVPPQAAPVAAADAPPFQFSFATPQDVPNLQEYLQQHFAAGKGKPRLVLPLCPSAEELLLQAFPAAAPTTPLQPAGCIRFKPSGYFEGQRIHLVDAFCIHPTYRKQGLATALLTLLRTETQARNMPYSLFLKEGAPLPIAHTPLYSSLYVYCRVDALPDPLSPSSLSSSLSSNIFEPSSAQVEACIRATCILRPHTFICWDPANPNQLWRMWRDGHEWLLLCVQNAYQELETPAGKSEQIGWMTALLESPGFAASPKRAAVLETLLCTTPYPWIWTDRVFVMPSLFSAAPSSAWQSDGPFHWYSYGWTTCLRPGSNYVLVV